MTELTREGITELLRTSDKAVERALMVVFNNQTADEQNTGAVVHHNGRGFIFYHAEIGTSMVKQLQRRGFLTQGQISFWRKRNGRGIMNIALYWRQLIEAAKAKKVEDVSFAFGNNECL
jgi:hypothetical protein